MISTIFKNDYTEAFSKNKSDFMSENCNEILDCNEIRDYIDNLKFYLLNNADFRMFIKYKFDNDDDTKNLKWDCKRCVYYIEGN